MIVYERKKWQNKKPTVLLTQMLNFFNSEKTWMKVPYDSKHYKSVDSMRATYRSAMNHYGLPKVSIKAFSDCIMIMRKENE